MEYKEYITLGQERLKSMKSQVFSVIGVTCNPKKGQKSECRPQGISSIHTVQ